VFGFVFGGVCFIGGRRSVLFVCGMVVGVFGLYSDVVVLLSMGCFIII